MLTFTAITLDSLLEQGAHKSVAMPVPDSKPISTKSTLHQNLSNHGNNGGNERVNPPPIPLPDSKHSFRKSVHQKLETVSNHPDDSSVSADNPSSEEKKSHWVQISPALYATPEVTPLPDTTLPDSPSSFPPSPYIVNHKRRGPRLLKSSSQGSVPLQPPPEQKSLVEQKVVGDVKGAGNEVIAEKVVANEEGSQKKVIASATSLPASFSVPSPIKEEEHAKVVAGAVDLVKGKSVNGLHNEEIRCTCVGTAAVRTNDLVKQKYVNGSDNAEIGNGCLGNDAAGSDDLVKLAEGSPEVDDESTDFLDPKESMSYASSSDGEFGGVAERSLNINTPTVEFFDAWDDLSSESGAHTSSRRNVEVEVREMRLNLLAEIEKKKQMEEALNGMQNRWRTIVLHFSDVGLTIPPDSAILEDERSPAEVAEELCRQVHLSRVVSESMGRAAAKAEAEMELEAQMEAKKFEIGRLLDRINYYEAVNREMSQRNQENIEKARWKRQLRKRRQRWYWGFVAAAITIGTGALVWTYIPSGNGSTPSSHSLGQENDPAN